MKIPENKVLAALTLCGAILSAVSSYWIGRRDELNQIIGVGMSYEDGINVTVVDKKHRPVSLFIKAEEA